MESSNWKPVPFDTCGISMDDLECFGGIEELTDYQLIKGDGKLTRKRKAVEKKQKKSKKSKIKSDSSVVHENLSTASEDTDMSHWNNIFLHDAVRDGLQHAQFHSPTQIQELSIPPAMNNCDILGAAETGSGKTLAFGIPIVTKILSMKESSKYQAYSEENGKPLLALILTPTRELAIQIKKHLQVICKFADIGICVVVGGMAPEKQRRILKKCPDIVVATPGRLWELIEDGEPHVSKVPDVRYLVIDEADRMVEKGHFAELTQIMELINCNTDSKKRQNFVFSATLTLVHEVPNRFLMKGKKSKQQQKQKLDSLINLVGMKNPKIVDITKKTAVVETLTETQIMCSNEQKDSYLYYFLKMYPHRTLVFCNSIECVRRLKTVLELLDCRPLPLHASMQQRQRLKNLERFESSGNGVLLATDVAARGLDIKGVEHVVHFQVPRTAETYVHRSGRTARAQREGLSLMLIEPQDAMFYKRICRTLNKDQSLPNFPVDQNAFQFLKDRVALARSIDQMEHRLKRMKSQNNWVMHTAKEMDIEIDDENLLNDMGDGREHAVKLRQIKIMKKRLSALLQKPVHSQSLTGKYPTKTGKLVESRKGSQRAVAVMKKNKRD